MDTETVAGATDRRTFLGRAGVAAAGVAAFGALPAVAKADAGGITPGDVEILVAAEIAEALAVTTYTNITQASVRVAGSVRQGPLPGWCCPCRS